MDPPLPRHPPSSWLRLFSSQTFSRRDTHNYSQIQSLFTYLPMKMEQTQCSETQAYKIQTPGNYPEENIQHKEHGESLKSRIYLDRFSLLLFCAVTEYVYLELTAYNHQDSHLLVLHSVQSVTIALSSKYNPLISLFCLNEKFLLTFLPMDAEEDTPLA